MEVITEPVKKAAEVRRILLIDDDEMIRILFQEMFWIYSPHEVEVTTVRSIADAYESLNHATEYPDVVVLGLSLLTKTPDGSMVRSTSPSFDFINEMKLRKRDVKIVIYSRHNESGLKERAKAIGADHYIVKGEMTPKEIVDFVESL
ncbi:MAG TPA: response regulator [Candidatus Paceibacterota bacterium]